MAMLDSFESKLRGFDLALIRHNNRRSDINDLQRHVRDAFKAVSHRELKVTKPFTLGDNVVEVGEILEVIGMYHIMGTPFVEVIHCDESHTIMIQQEG